MRKPSGEKGYTLIEALVVVAIVGIVSLVTVPNFMQYMRSAKLKNGAREFAIDLREARQKAVTQYHPTKIGIKSGAGQSQYIIADGEYDSSAAGGIAWTISSTEDFEPTVYFSTTNLTDSADADTWIDIVFLPNGTITNGTTSSGVDVDLPTSPKIVISTTDKVPKDSYTVELSSAGGVKLE